MSIASPLKWHGGKGAYNGKLAQWIIGKMPTPKPLHYVETHFGGGSVLLYLDPEGVSEVVNDLNGRLTNFWTALQNPRSFERLRRRLQVTPFSQTEWHRARSRTDDAAAFLVECRMSLAGRGKAFAPLSRTRTRRGMNEQASAWLSVIDGLLEVHERLQRVVILNADALEVIAQQDGPQTCFYLDPPYLHETRATTADYECEMTPYAHLDLLDALDGIKGKFLLSGYRSAMYDDVAKTCGWNRHEFKIPNNAAGGKQKREMTECLWTNF